MTAPLSSGGLTPDDLTRDPLTRDSLTSDLKAAIVPYTNFRIALATAVLGSIGTSIVWLVFLAIESRDPKLLGTVAVGASIGFAAHWFQHYARAAILERGGDPVPHAARRSRIALLWAASSGLIALAAEHLLGEMVTTFLVPFFASLLSLVPAGAIIGWSMSRGRKTPEDLPSFFANGMKVGLLITAVTAILWGISFGFGAPEPIGQVTHPVWFRLLSWWGLIGLGMRYTTRPDRNAVQWADPILAVVLVFVATFVINLLPIKDDTFEPLGVLGGIPKGIAVMAAGIQASPALPGRFSIDSVQRGPDERGSGAHPNSAKHPAVERLVPGPSTVTPENLSKAGNDAGGAAQPTPTDAIAMARSASRAQFICSWLIILVFAVGAGLAPGVERSLRPADYPNSQTFKRDRGLTLVMIGLLAVACVVGRVSQMR